MQCNTNTNQANPRQGNTRQEKTIATQDNTNSCKTQQGMPNHNKTIQINTRQHATKQDKTMPKQDKATTQRGNKRQGCTIYAETIYDHI